MVISRGNDANRVAMFLFAPDAARPVAVLKVGRRSDRNHAVEHEQAGLAAMRPYLDETLRHTIPEPLGIFQWGGLQIGLESCAPGHPMSASTYAARVSKQRRMDDLHRVADWLTTFNCQAQPQQGLWDSARLKQWIEEPLAAYQAAFGATAAEDRLFDSVRERAWSLVGAALPTAWVHWGFEERNIFRDGQAIHVVDWEGASPGLPLYDLLYFVTRWSFSVRGLWNAAAQQRGFWELFLAPAAADSVVLAGRHVIGEYMTRLNIDHRFLAPLLVLTWVERALGRVNQRTAETQGLARMDNVYVDHVGSIAQYGGQVFEEPYGRW